MSLIPPIFLCRTAALGCILQARAPALQGSDIIKITLESMKNVRSDIFFGIRHNKDDYLASISFKVRRAGTPRWS